MSEPGSPERPVTDAEAMESSPGTDHGDTPKKGRKKKGEKKAIPEMKLTVEVAQWLRQENGKAVKVKIADLKIDKTKERGQIRSINYDDVARKVAGYQALPPAAFLAVSTIKQKDLGNAVGGALQHAIVMRYMLEADQTEQGATAATWDTQEEWLQRGIPLWVLDSKRGHEGHQQVHAAEAVQQDVVTEAPAEDTEPGAPAPTLPMQAKMKKTAKVVPTQGTAAGKGTPSSTKKQAKGKEKESDKPAESDDDDTDEESEEDDLEQVLETQQKRKRASASHFDASSPDSGKEQSKKKAKTAASATAEFKPPSRSGTLPSRGTVASPSGTSTTARSLGSRLAKVAGPKKK